MSRYDGDVQIVHTDDGGAITFRSGQPDMEQGLATAVYISLFTDEGWWADALAPAEERISGGKSPEALERLPLVNRTRQDYEEASRKRLAWLVEQGVAKSVTCEAAILGINALGLTVRIDEPDGTVTNLRYRMNWQGQRAALGGS